MAFYVYLLASKKHGTLYLGATKCDVVWRVYEHRTKAVGGFMTRYGVDKLVWFEIYQNAATAIAREKELKKWRRDSKIWPDRRTKSGVEVILTPVSPTRGLWLWIPGPRQGASRMTAR